MKKIAIILLAVLLAFSGCTEKPEKTNGTTSTGETIKEIIEIQLEAKAPFSTATITIHNNGNINYKAISLEMNIDQTDETKITIEQYKELVALIKENDFFSFNETYREENLMDATTYTITVKQTSNKETQSYRVSCYGECPEKVVEIRNKIKELWGKEILEVGV